MKYFLAEPFSPSALQHRSSNRTYLPSRILQQVHKIKRENFKNSKVIKTPDHFPFSSFKLSTALLFRDKAKLKLDTKPCSTPPHHQAEPRLAEMGISIPRMEAFLGRSLV